jgi:hypothetical protein
MVGMKRNIKQTLEIAETVSDPRVKLQARGIANDSIEISWISVRILALYLTP